MQLNALRIGAIGIVTAPLLALAATAAPAAAAGCEWDTGNVYSNDYRWVSLKNCSYGRVRHAYNPEWSGNNYWTSWKQGATYARTATNAELYDGETIVAR